MKSHLVIGLSAGLFLLPLVSYKVPFILVLCLASLLPDIDVAHSHLGQRWYFRPLQWFVKHRGVIHSFTLCFLISLVLAFIIPILALPFFLGYSIHLFLDSLTVEGIRPFWPFNSESAGVIKVGGKMEETVFVVFSILAVILVIRWFI